MDRSILLQVNEAVRARRACVLITDLGSGSARLVFPQDIAADDPLRPDLERYLATGGSGEVQHDGRTLFLRSYIPPLRLIVIGAVHISQALLPIATQLGWDAIIIDPRTIFATPERFPEAQLRTSWPHIALPEIGTDPSTAVVALTHDPKLDDEALHFVLSRDSFYCGALGSRKTHAKRIERLLAAGLTQDQVDRIRAPIGLPIGAATPAEIAIAVAAEIISAWRADRRGVA